jgi:TP901 family phage tail tape measure protein
MPGASEAVRLDLVFTQSGGNAVLASLKSIEGHAATTAQAVEHLSQAGKQLGARSEEGARGGGALSGALGLIAGGANVAWQALTFLGEGVSRVFGFIGGLAKSALELILAPLRAGVGLFMETAKWAALAGTAIAEEFVRRGVASFAEYQAAIVNASTVTGLIGDALQKAKRDLFDFALGVSLVSSQSPTAVARLLYGLGSAGLSVPQMQQVTPAVVALSEATATDTLQTAELVMTSLNQFRLGAEGATRVVNVFAAAIGATPFTMQRLQYFMQYAGPVAANLGLTPERTVATGGALMKMGLPAEMAGTGFRQTLSVLLNPPAEGIAILKRHGLALQDVNVAARGLLPVLDSLKAANLSQAELFKLFGNEAANAASILINAASPGILAIERQITGTNRAFDMQWEQLNTVKGQWTILKSTVEALQIQLARGMEPALMRILRWLNAFTAALWRTRGMESLGAWIGAALESGFAWVVSHGNEIWAWAVNLWHWGEWAFQTVVKVGKSVAMWFRPEMLAYYGQVWAWLGNVMRSVLGRLTQAPQGKLPVFEWIARIPEFLGRGLAWLWDQVPRAIDFGAALASGFLEAARGAAALAAAIGTLVAVQGLMLQLSPFKGIRDIGKAIEDRAVAVVQAALYLGTQTVAEWQAGVEQKRVAAREWWAEHGPVPQPPVFPSPWAPGGWQWPAMPSFPQLAPAGGPSFAPPAYAYAGGPSYAPPAYEYAPPMRQVPSPGQWVPGEGGGRGYYAQPGGPHHVIIDGGQVEVTHVGLEKSVGEFSQGQKNSEKSRVGMPF